MDAVRLRWHDGDVCRCGRASAAQLSARWRTGGTARTNRDACATKSLIVKTRAVSAGIVDVAPVKLLHVLWSSAAFTQQHQPRSSAFKPQQGPGSPAGSTGAQCSTRTQRLHATHKQQAWHATAAASHQPIMSMSAPAAPLLLHQHGAMAGAVAWRCALSVLLAGAMARRGRARGALSTSGACAAVAVGILHLTCGVSYGAVLIAFYLSSSRLTRLRQTTKACYVPLRLNGQRNATQVLCSSMGGGLAALLVVMAPALASDQATVQALQLGAWCAFLASYACCCGDTYASELGMLSATPPRLITSWQRVPHGVNGAVSALGLAASAAGGACMGGVMAAAGRLSGESAHLVPLMDCLLRCAGGQQLGASAAGQQQAAAAFMLLLGMLAGVAGSLLDSLLGARWQYSGLCEETRRVVGRPGPRVRHISGSPCLSNEAVNAAAAALTSVTCGAGCYWWCLMRATTH